MIEAPLSNAKVVPMRSVNREYRERVRTFIVANFYVADVTALADQTSLLDGGVIDSTGVLEVIQFVEAEFAIAVADDEIVPENLDSIERIASYIERKRA